MPGVPEKYHALLDEALAKAGIRTGAGIGLGIGSSASPEMKEGVAFLIAYMPERDLTLDERGRFLLDQCGVWLMKARNRFAWAKSVPDSIFLNEVLPYACTKRGT